MAESVRTVSLCPLELEARAIRKAVDVEVHVIGLRAANVPELPSNTRVILAGLAGALDPTLRPGDLVIDTPISGLPQDLPWRVGSIHTSDQLVSTHAEKAALFRETAALAVDMERAILCHVAQNVMGLRAISDPADMTLDPAVLRFIDNSGRPRPLTVAATLLRRPSLLPHLLTLRRNTNLALQNLALGVRAVLESLDRFPPAPGVAYAPSDHL